MLRVSGGAQFAAVSTASKLVCVDLLSGAARTCLSHGKLLVVDLAAASGTQPKEAAADGADAQSASLADQNGAASSDIVALAIDADGQDACRIVATTASKHVYLLRVSRSGDMTPQMMVLGRRRAKKRVSSVAFAGRFVLLGDKTGDVQLVCSESLRGGGAA